MARLRNVIIGISLLLGVSQPVTASNLFSLQDLNYKGAMRIPVGVYGESRMGFANGTFTVDPSNNSFFIVGHQHQQAIAEFKIAGFGISESVIDLPMAPPPIQEFSIVLDRPPTGNYQELNRITGLELIGGSLVVNAAASYDGNADNTHTTMIIEDPSNLKDSAIKGYAELDSKVHSAGWMTSIPRHLQDDFNANYLFGFASNLSINARSSIGPTAFAVRSDDVLSAGSGETIPTVPLMDFSINNRLHDDLTNTSGTNDLWTEVSNAYIGFIVPGTDTYAVFGTSGGHESGIGYKIKQDTGTLCAGYCPHIASDVYNYYWLWNIQDFLKVKNGELKPYEVKPYEYGSFVVPHQGGSDNSVPKLINAVSFDSENNRLYFILGAADGFQSKYENAPLMLSYEVNVGQRPNSPTNLVIE